MISIITPARNNPDKLDRFLASVEADLRLCPDDAEVIVVDDTSTLDLKCVTDKYPGVAYARLMGHPGPAAARNRGAREAKGERLLFFDSDVILKPGTLKAFCDDFDRGEAAVVGEYDIEPVEKGFFAEFKALLTESWTPKTRYVSVFALRAAGITREAFNRAGGFDEKIKTASVEDFEFGNRLAKAGLSIAYNPNIVVKHFHPSFCKQMKLFYLRSRDWTELFLERGGKFDNWCASPTEGLGSVTGTLFLAAFLAFIVDSNNKFLGMALTVLLLIYMGFNRHFIETVVKRRGFWFVPVSLIAKLPLSIMITAGFAAGLITFPINRLRKRRP